MDTAPQDPPLSDAEPFRVGCEPNPSFPMQPESSQYEEETPSLLWGLDPVFVAFAKLYIGDILDLKESRQVPGVFFYKGHPIKQVEILGTVIGRREKDAFYSYGATTATATLGVLNLTSQLKKLQDTIEQKTKIEIGDIVQIRGYVHTYREEREIRVTTYYKVDDPVCNIQILRMLELPRIYRKVYDQPFRSPALEQESSDPGALDLANLTCLLSERAKEFLVENKVQTFYQQELEIVESLMSLANQPVIHSAGPEQGDAKNDSTSKAIHSIFKNAIQLLQEEGFVFQKDDGFDKLYYMAPGCNQRRQRTAQKDPPYHSRRLPETKSRRREGLPLSAHLGLCPPECEPGPERRRAAAGAGAPGGPERHHQHHRALLHGVLRGGRPMGWRGRAKEEEERVVVTPGLGL
ncbi:CST complex subunit STN1 isoform X4 [Lontra canadensis]|uniref:CST complex subunit STN1 isoform X4 n=1 Tax=Lontra canadensis TaxID=76717 RepID=UPI0013F3375E|nr:CST complex subunit STN1 isoform X4 [Lontra canadensis]